MNTLKHYRPFNMAFICITAMLFSAMSLTVQAINQHCHLPGELDPLLVDLGQNGIHLGPAGRGVNFDLAGNGQIQYMQWTAPFGDEAFLAMDKNGNGIVDDGSELFTNYNLLLIDGIQAPNGFADLAQYDRAELGGNDDGYITAEDQVWPQLILWKDRNADGVSTADEIYKPQLFDITHFNTVPRVNGRRDGAGNYLGIWSWAKKPRNYNGNRNYKIVDVYFKPLS